MHRGEFASDVLRQVHYRRLRCGIGENPRQRQMRRGAGDVQDCASARFRHLSSENLTAPVNGFEIAVDHTIPVVVLQIKITRGVIHARSIDEHVDATMQCDHIVQ